MKLNTLAIAKQWMELNIKEGSLCIDATAGRGHDTVFLCEKVGAGGKVIAFDIQEEAVESTNMLLAEKHLSHIAKVYLESHTEMDRYADNESIDGIMFNFGYLPGGDHEKATQAETSIIAIEKGLRLLKKQGVMSLCIYHGGDSGFEEKNALMNYLQTLDSKQYTVAVCELCNKPNYPPIAVLVQKH